jgi:hypothetical protein
MHRGQDVLAAPRNVRAHNMLASLQSLLSQIKLPTLETNYSKVILSLQVWQSLGQFLKMKTMQSKLTIFS